MSNVILPNSKQTKRTPPVPRNTPMHFRAPGNTAHLISLQKQVFHSAFSHQSTESQRRWFRSFGSTPRSRRGPRGARRCRPDIEAGGLAGVYGLVQAGLWVG